MAEISFIAESRHQWEVFISNRRGNDLTTSFTPAPDNHNCKEVGFLSLDDLVRPSFHGTWVWRRTMIAGGRLRQEKRVQSKSYIYVGICAIQDTYKDGDRSPRNNKWESFPIGLLIHKLLISKLWDGICSVGLKIEKLYSVPFDFIPVRCEGRQEMRGCSMLELVFQSDGWLSDSGWSLYLIRARHHLTLI